MVGTSLGQKPRPTRTPSALDTALYTYDMLISLKRLAEQHNQARLACLIEAAAAEAQLMAKAQGSQNK